MLNTNAGGDYLVGGMNYKCDHGNGSIIQGDNGDYPNKVKAQFVKGKRGVFSRELEDRCNYGDFSSQTIEQLVSMLKT